MVFDFKKPTVQLLGRWQPWHEGHTALFKKALEQTGQVVIMVRDVNGADAGMGNKDNPFHMREVRGQIDRALEAEGYTNGIEYHVMLVPNIVDISYGRKVGYTFTEQDLGEEIHEISATKIRRKMRREGTLEKRK